MAPTSSKKRDTLIRNFEILKDNYEDNGQSLRSIVVKMFKIDAGMAIDMWTYLLSNHEDELEGEDPDNLAYYIVNEGQDALGDEEFEEVILGNPVIKNALFAKAGGYVYFYGGNIIQHQIGHGNLQLADELLSMVYNNPNKRDSWYEVMDRVIPDYADDDFELSEEGYDMLEMWCDKVEDEEERARLSVKMMEFMD